MSDRLINLLAAALVLVLGLTLLVLGHPGWGLLALYLGGLAIWLYHRYRAKGPDIARLKVDRVGEDFDSFFERLNRPDYDRRMVWQVYTAVRSMAGLDVADIALRPYDDLVRDLKIDPDDLGDALWNGLKGPLGLADTARANPHSHRRNTVGGLIDFIASQPKARAQALAATAPSTPSARRT